MSRLKWIAKSDIASSYEKKVLKDDSYGGKVELSHSTESTIEYTDSGSPVAFLSQVKDILSKLNTEDILSELNTENVLSELKVEDVLMLGKNNLLSIIKAKSTLSYYGLTKGSNHFVHCDTVILQGPFYFPNYFYNDLKTHSRVQQVKVDRLVAAHAFQELMRSALRKSEDITLIIGDDDPQEETSGWIEFLLNHITTFHDVELIEEESEEERKYKLYYSRYGIAHVLKSIGDERLRKTLKNLTLEYPELIDGLDSPKSGMVEINISEITKKWNKEFDENRRPDKVLQSIENLVEGSKNTLCMEIIQKGTSRSKPTLIKFWINRNNIVQ